MPFVTEIDQKLILIGQARFVDIKNSKNERQLSGNEALCEY